MDYATARDRYLTAHNHFQNLRPYDRASVLIGLGICAVATGRYSEGLLHFEDATEIAEAGGFVDLQLIVAGNRVTLYRRMADVRSAERLMQTVEQLVPRSRNALVVSQSATVVRGSSFDHSIKLYAAALQLAAAAGDRYAEAIIWNQIGSAFEEKGRLDEADRAFTEAFRIRALTGRKHLQASYFYLGRLRTRQGDYQSAIRLLELARSPDAQIQLPYVHHALARALYLDGQTGRALREFETAVQSLREWRLQVIPAEAFRVSSEAFSQQIFTNYIDAGMAIYRRTGDTRLAARMLEVAEDSRNWLAQQSLFEQKQLPPEYFQTLGKYRQALARSVAADNPQANADAEKYRLRLTEIEARLGIKTERQNFSQENFEKVGPGGALHGLRRKLKGTEAFLSFHSGTDATYVWAVTSGTFEAYRIAGRKDLEDGIREFRAALTDRKGDVRMAGRRVADTVLAPLSRTVRGKREWILSLDGPLFELPFAALPEGDGWVGASHTLRISSAALLDPKTPEEPVTEEFVAVADPVYNRADSRLSNPGASDSADLPRLPGTAREVASCARAWSRDPEPMVLSGTAIGREELMASVARRPAVLHLAAHVVPHPSFPDQVLVALGLRPSGQMEYLAPADIAFSRMPVGVVTLSGCGSGRGAALPGLGLFGLTRAWLMAGATAVVASHWPIADDSGELLAAMYERLGRTTGRLSPSQVADALQAAQVQMMNAGGWRADPVHWAAFTVIGKD